ncbi:alpha/beta hydrolase [Nocardiopsis sp. CNT312]|uniref:alpha/beta hydrolase n=1 Tax=Nocardiopsis sp. CNT312 TaxID=1137268 RepID=UPI0009E04660|nr:alpha/beta hydrolase [Nocardiopsis sp. CNT312]
MRRGVSALGAGAVLTAAALTTGCAPGPAAPEPEPVPEETVDPFELFVGQQVDWETCYDGAEVDEFVEEYRDWGADPDWKAALECGTVTVPVDYELPEGETIDLALVRVPADGPQEERVGSLVLNPGGPGQSGVEMLDFPRFSDEVRSAFDLVSFDPRGVGDSQGFACGDWEAVNEEVEDVEVGDLTGLPEERVASLEEDVRAYVDDCVDTVGEGFLANMGTVNVARDLDVLRGALGDDRLTYVGYSYGTYIGSLYAEMFPDHTRALILDGAVETERPNVEVGIDQGLAFQATWEDFVGHCAENASFCAFDGVAGSQQRMEQILTWLDEEPFTVEDLTVDGPAFVGMLAMELYNEFTWVYLADMLAYMSVEDRAATEYYLGFMYENTYAWLDEEEDGKDANAPLVAVNCADRDDPEDIGVYFEAVDGMEEDSPLFGAGAVWGNVLCAYWPETETAPTGFTAPDAPPVVVAGNVGDPATPYAWSQELAEQLDTATLVTYEGSGHTIYGHGVSTCIDDPLDGYLLTGTVPEEGLSCPQVDLG